MIMPSPAAGAAAGAAAGSVVPGIGTVRMPTNMSSDCRQLVAINPVIFINGPAKIMFPMHRYQGIGSILAPAFVLVETI